MIMNWSQRNETKLAEIAREIYSAVSGADNRDEKAERTQAIYEWLYYGDPFDLDDPITFERLVAEWIDYDA